MQFKINRLYENNIHYSIKIIYISCSFAKYVITKKHYFFQVTLLCKADNLNYGKHIKV